MRPCISGNATRAYPPPNWRECVKPRTCRGMELAFRHWVSAGQLAHDTACARISGNGAERDCRNAAERLGFRWLGFGVNADATEDRARHYEHHKLYCMVRPGERPPPHRAMSAATWTRLCGETGCVGRDYLERTERVLAGMGQRGLGL